MDKPKEIEEILITEKRIERRIIELGKTISKDYKSKNLLLVSILKGSIIFLSDLLRNLNLSCDIDFMSVSSYGKQAESSGIVRMIMDLKEDIYDKNVIIIEDIVDTGLTVSYLMKNLSLRKPGSLKICALLDKPSNRKIKINLDYVGFTVPNKFVVGYGLDYNGKFRNLPYVGVLKIYNVKN